jgi:hypothetical protein
MGSGVASAERFFLRERALELASGSSELKTN